MLIDTMTAEFVRIGGKYYVNSEAGRTLLKTDCGEDVYNSVIDAWGKTILPDSADVFSALQLDMISEVNTRFTARVSGSITTSQGYLMQFDTSDSLKMQGAISLMEATGQTEGYLTQADDTTVYHVPLATMKAVLVEMLAAYAACHARKQQLRAAIKAAETTEDLDAVVISWPV